MTDEITIEGARNAAGQVVKGSAVAYCRMCDTRYRWPSAAAMIEHFRWHIAEEPLLPFIVDNAATPLTLHDAERGIALDDRDAMTDALIASGRNPLTAFR